jgi:hypothetical protein
MNCLPKPIPKIVGRRAAWAKAPACNSQGAASAAANQEGDNFQEMVKRLEQQRNDVRDAARVTEEEAEAALTMFKDQVKVETANLLKQISDLQAMILTNDEAQTRRAQRAEERAEAREKRMEVKFNTIMASLGLNSAQTPCPQSDEESEDVKSEHRGPASAAAASRTPAAAKTDAADEKANSRARTRSPVERTQAKAGAKP